MGPPPGRAPVSWSSIVRFRCGRRVGWTTCWSDWDPPRRVEWREDDGHDLIAVTYLLQAAGEGTRFTQRDEAKLSAPRILRPAMRAAISADIARQLKRLRSHLEAGREESGPRGR
jgi:hypothetical protein